MRGRSGEYHRRSPPPLPRSFARFLWDCTRGLRPLLLALTLLTALIGAFEAALFAMLGWVVDWIAAAPPERIWAERGTGFAALLLASTVLVWFQALVKHQALAGSE